MMIDSFSHSGTLGDLLYSFNFLYDYCDEFNLNKINFHLQTNVPLRATIAGHPGNGFQIDHKIASYLVPLLSNIPIIGQLTVGDKVPGDYFNLDVFRDMGYGISRFDIKAYYYGVLSFPIKRSLDRKVLWCTNQDQRAKDKVVVFRSLRYNAVDNYKALEKIKDKVIFIGTKLEQQTFSSGSFQCEYIEIKDFQDAANLMAGANFVVGNQTGLFAIAEQLKVNRILESQQRLPNVVCAGGLCYEGINDAHFNSAVESMINKHYGA